MYFKSPYFSLLAIWNRVIQPLHIKQASGLSLRQAWMALALSSSSLLVSCWLFFGVLLSALFLARASWSTVNWMALAAGLLRR